MGYLFDYLMGSLLTLIFYGFIIGIIVYAVHLSNKKKNAQPTVSSFQIPTTDNDPNPTPNQIINQLEKYEKLPEFSNNRAHFSAVIQALRNNYLPSSKPNTALLPLEAIETGSVSTTSSTDRPSPVKQANPFEILQNINILLYVGAFLVVGSTALLVGTNSESFSGVSKFMLVVLFAVIFYITGITFYTRINKLKPAGLTFTAIGMLMLPFIAVSYSNFIDTNVDIASLWFITSLFGVGLYSLTYYFMRSVLLEYLVLLMGVSSVGSGVLAINLPLYWMAWAGVVTSTLYLLVAEYSQKTISIKSTLVMAHIIAPIGLLIGLSEMSDDLWSVAITFLLAGGFYILSSFVKAVDETSRPVLLGIGQILWLFAVIAGGYDLNDAGKWIGLGLFAMVTALLLACLALSKIKMISHARVTSVVAIIGLTMSILASTPFGNIMFGIVLAALFVFFIIYSLTRYTEQSVIGFIMLMLLPITYVLFWQDLSINYASDLLTILYLLISLLTFTISYIRQLPNAIRNGLVVSTQVAVTFAAFATMAHLSELSIALFGAASILEFAIAWKYGNAVAIIAAGFYFFVGISMLNQVYDIDTVDILWIAIVSASLWCVVGLLIKKIYSQLTEYATSFLTIGSIILALSWLLSFGFDNWQLVISSVIITVLSTIFSRIYVMPNVLTLGAFTLYVSALAFIPRIEILEYEHAPYFFVMVGLLLYGLSFLAFVNNKEKKILRYGAIVGPVVGSVFENDWPSILSTTVAGSLLAAQATIERNRFALYVGAGIGVIALSRLLIKADIDEVQIYTHIWSVYFALLAWLESRREQSNKDSKDILTVLALMVLTIPAVLQALDSTETWRGILLIVESVGLVMLGIFARYKLVLYWGISVMAIEVLYQLRSVIAVIPKSFFLLLLGLGVLGTAMYFLLRRKDDGV